MRNVLLIDLSVSFLEDMSRTMLINEVEGAQIISETDLNRIGSDIEQYKITQIVVNAKLLDSWDWNYSIPVYCYVRSNKDMEFATRYQHIPCYGIVSRSEQLLNAIIADKYLTYTTQTQQTQQTQTAPPSKEESVMDFAGANMQTKTTEQPMQTVPGSAETDDQSTQLLTQDQQTYQNQQTYQYPQTYNPATEGFYDETGTFRVLVPVMSYDEYGNQIVAKGYYDERYGHYFVYTPPANQSQQAYQQTYQQNYQNQQSYQQTNAQQTVQQSQPQQNTEPPVQQTPEKQKGRTSAASSIREKERKIKEKEDKKIQESAEEAFMEDFKAPLRSKTKCISVFSAKGGVGKTTIACELATFLALTAHHRGKYKVCIADFNIDFGDVLNTLGMDQFGNTMSLWAEDIQYRIENECTPSRIDNEGAPNEKKHYEDDELRKIEYTEAQIKNWLQYKERDGLYALLAPLSNLDSMKIKPHILKVMFNNLLKNGGFDFLICDTGNNTRDSSFMALEYADIVLMVLTQDINTANDNNSFFHTAERAYLNMDKIKVVINRVLPAKEVGVSVEEVESEFQNAQEGRSYKFECVARIADDSAVRCAGNTGEPLVYNSGHGFTKSIGQIAKRITGQETELTAPKKKGFFAKMFGK